jgi:signal transduction histidine kinase/ligand-binding sensor domain-containing protein
MTAGIAYGDSPNAGLQDYTVTTWNESNGLGDSLISSLGQDRDGFLWIGTESGLVRFDGVRFVPFRAANDVRPPSGAVTALTSARDGSLWFGTTQPERGLGRIVNGSLTLYGEADGLVGMTLCLLEDRTGVLWAGTSRGFFRFSGNRWQPVTGQPALLDGTGVVASVLALHEARDGSLWAATRSAVVRRSPGAAQFERIREIRVSSNVWQGFAEDDDGVVWISDFSEGFRRAQDAATALTPRRGWGVKLMHDRRGSLWVATRGQGLWRVASPASGRAQVNVITTVGGLASDAVQAVFEDREGNIWVGTHAGLHRLTPHKVTPLANLPIARALTTTPDGNIWIGTSAGLTQIREDGRTHYGPRDALPGNVVLAMQSDRDGALWLATERGVTRFADGRFSPILLRPGDDVQRVFSIAPRNGTLWLRDVNRRLVHATPDGRILPLDDIPAPFHTSVGMVASDREGRLWIFSTTGRLGVQSADGTFQAHDLNIGRVTAFYEDEDGRIWLGAESGLSRFEGGRFTTITAKSGLPAKVRSIVEDADGRLWIGVVLGIARLEESEFEKAAANPAHQVRYRLFNTADGAAGVPVTEGSRGAVRASDGRLWWATSGGVTVVDPANVGEPRPLAPVKIESVTADATSYRPESNLSLPPRTSHLQFAFTALTLTDSVRVQFRYRLDGYDQSWVNAGTSRQVSYTNLPPGTYRFRVAASNGDGVWSEPGAALELGIQPMFYQTRWFYALSFALAFSAVYGAWWLNARRVRKQFALVLAERIRMSRAIHDTLLQGLAGLALQLDDLSHGMSVAAPSSGVRDKVLRMRRRVEDYIREARQSIWDLRSPTLEGRPFPEALREAGRRVIADRPVALDLNVVGTPRACSPAVQEQLLLICQEALSNAVQHGHPSRVGVELEYTGNRVRVRVSDDGCGFDPDSVTSEDGHYGVVSMRERAAQVRGQLTIASAPGQGTRVETVVPQA